MLSPLGEFLTCDTSPNHSGLYMAYCPLILPVLTIFHDACELGRVRETRLTPNRVMIFLSDGLGKKGY